MHSHKPELRSRKLAHKPTHNRKRVRIRRSRCRNRYRSSYASSCSSGCRTVCQEGKCASWHKDHSSCHKPVLRNHRWVLRSKQVLRNRKPVRKLVHNRCRSRSCHSLCRIPCCN